MTQGVDAAAASTIFEAIDEVMTDNSIPWKNCIAFSVDNTSANLGQFNSIKTRVLERNPNGNRAPVAQLVEHRVVTREVVSSTPAGPTLRVLK